MFKIFYEGPFESILSSGESRNIEPVGLDKINTDESAFEGGSYETPFLCRVNEIKAAGVNMIYVSKLMELQNHNREKTLQKLLHRNL